MDETDWVSQRYRCTSERVFAALYYQVEKDVRSMNQLNAARKTEWKFKVEKEVDEQRITVLKHFSDEEKPRSAVHFSFVFRENRIDIYRYLHDGFQVQRDSPFRVALRWDEKNGMCNLSIDDQDCELWQVSARALEHLFFKLPDF